MNDGLELLGRVMSDSVNRLAQFHLLTHGHSTAEYLAAALAVHI